MIKVKHKGNFDKLENFFRRSKEMRTMDILAQCGKEGVAALSSATPVDSGKTAASWSYEVVKENGRYRINWLNSNINKGVNIAIIIQYGHATGNGGYVEATDYINPAMKTVFDKMAEDLWKEVCRV